MKMEEQVRKLEGQLKESFKGQMDMLPVVKENMELTERVRELERKTQVQGDRMREYEEIMRRTEEDSDKKDTQVKVLKQENEGMSRNMNSLEE